MATARILVGDALESLSKMASGSVRCCVTSPPYWGLRDYGVDGQIGLESTPEEFVAKLVAVFREVRRVLADDGTLWLNLGDSMGTKGSSGKGEKQITNAGTLLADRRWRIPPGLKPKDLVGIPWMVAFALRADGWYLRSEIIWHKLAPMPESVTDRPTKAHEQLFLLSKSANYFYDADAIAEPSVTGFTRDRSRPDDLGVAAEKSGDFGSTSCGIGETRNKRSVWTIGPQPFDGAHFAVMPEALVEPCVLAGSERGDLVLDPFAGSGTVGVVALKNGRDFAGCELNPKYAEVARNRIRDDAPLLNRVE